MLPVLVTLVLQPSWAPFALGALAILIGLWQGRAAHLAGEPVKKAVQAGAVWAAGAYGAMFLLVRALGGQNLFAMERPLAIPVHTYGLLIATAFLVAMWIAGRSAQRAGLDKERTLDLSFWLLVAGMVGSRVLFIIVNWDEYARDPASMLAFWKGGLVFYGGFIAALLFALWYLRRNRIAFLPYADVLAPAVAIGHGIGRLGCFAAGCCWGEACSAAYPLAAHFPPESLAYQSQLTERVIQSGALTTIGVHPTQLYESIGAVSIFLFLSVWRSRKRFHGEVLALYLVLYAPLRALVESFRGDEERGRVFNFLGAWARGAWWNLSTSELISVLLFATGVALYVVLGRRARRDAPVAPAAPAAAA